MFMAQISNTTQSDKLVNAFKRNVDLNILVRYFQELSLVSTKSLMTIKIKTDKFVLFL